MTKLLHHFTFLFLAIVTIIQLNNNKVISQPANDDCSGATPITLGMGSCTPTPYDNTGATGGFDGCAGIPWFDFWFTFTVTNDEITIVTGSYPDGDVTVYEIYGSCDSADLVACQDVGQNSSWDVSLSLGTYYLRISRTFWAPKGNIYFCIWEDAGCNVTVDVTPIHTSGGLANGSATATPSGGSGYTYVWNNGQTKQMINNLSAGMYIV